MLFVGKKEALKFISDWENTLGPNYKKAWQIFKERRDKVAKTMGLNEKEIIFVTVRELANFVIWDTKHKFNILTAESTKVRGNTAGFKILEQVGRVYKEYDAKCAYFQGMFDKEMAKLNNNRR